jgi:hypothetical protein
MKKPILLLTSILMLGQVLKAQSSFSNSTSETISKVICDYHAHFEHLTSAQISKQGPYTRFASNVNAPGSTDCMIIKKNGEKHECAWKAVFITSSDFALVSAKYKEVFEQVSNTVIRIPGERPVIVNGQFVNPSSTKRSNAISFQLVPSAGELQQLHVDLTMQQKDGQWVLALIVHDGASADEANLVFN